MINIRRGDVVDIRLPEVPQGSCVQSGERPCVVTSNNMCNKFSNVITVSPITKSQTKKDLPTHVKLSKSYTKLNEHSLVLCEQIITVDKHKIKDRMAVLTEQDMKAVNKALAVQLGI